MSWRDEKADHLQKSRDFSFLHDDDRSHKEVQRSRQAKASDDRVPENQEARDRLLRLKALEKQRADKQKKHYVESSSPDEREQRRETERNPGVSGIKRGPSGNDKFGSFFGKVEKVVAKRVVDEQRAREIAARERRLAEAEKAKARAESRNGSDAKHSMRPGSSSGSRPAAKPKPQNPVTVKAQKLKDNRDYSFLFSDDGAAEARDSRPEPGKVLKESRPSADGPIKQKPVASQAQKARAASNGAVRPSSGQGFSSGQPRKPAASRPVGAGGRDNNARDSRGDSERRSEKESRSASGGRAERDSRPDRDGRHGSERRAEQGRSVASSSRGASVGKSAGHERAASKGVGSKLPVASDREKRANLERPTSAARPKPTNHDRAAARDSSATKSSSQTRVSQSSGQRISQSGNAMVRERVVQKSTTETRVSQSVHRGAQSGASAMKRKMVGEAARKPVITAKSNDGRRVDRSRYGDSDSESEMRRLVAGGPRPPQSAGPRISKASVGLGRKLSDEAVRRKTIDAPIRRKAVEEPLRRKSSDEVMRSRPAPAKERKRQRQSESESESESDGGRARKSGVSSIIQKLFRYNPNKYADLDDEDDKNMETSFKHIQAEERRSARLAREEDEREQELIEAEERAERERKLRRQKMMK